MPRFDTHTHGDHAQGRPAPFRRQSTLLAAKVSLKVLEKVMKATPVFGTQLGEIVGIASAVVKLVEVRCFLYFYRE